MFTTKEKLEFVYESMIMEETTNGVQLVSLSDVSIDDVKEFQHHMFPQYPEDMLDNIFVEKNVNYKKSVVAVLNGKIVGLLVMGSNSIFDIMENDGEILETYMDLDEFKGKSVLEGILLAVVPELRSSGLAMRICKSLELSGVDYVVNEVYMGLNTHNFWKRVGFKQALLMNDGEDDFLVYIKRISI